MWIFPSIRWHRKKWENSSNAKKCSDNYARWNLRSSLAVWGEIDMFADRHIRMCTLVFKVHTTRDGSDDDGTWSMSELSRVQTKMNARKYSIRRNISIECDAHSCTCTSRQLPDWRNEVIKLIFLGCCSHSSLKGRSRQRKFHRNQQTEIIS